MAKYVCKNCGKPAFLIPEGMLLCETCANAQGIFVSRFYPADKLGKLHIKLQGMLHPTKFTAYHFACLLGIKGSKSVKQTMVGFFKAGTRLIPDEIGKAALKLEAMSVEELKKLIAHAQRAQERKPKEQSCLKN